MPNMEFNERSTLVINGDFGNRLDTDDPEALFPVMFEIVDELLMMTPSGQSMPRGSPSATVRPPSPPIALAAVLDCAQPS